MGVGGQCHAPAALPPGKTRYPLYRRMGGPQGQSGRMRKISPSPGFDPPTFRPVASRYTDWVIPAYNQTCLIYKCIFRCLRYNNILWYKILFKFSNSSMYLTEFAVHGSPLFHFCSFSRHIHLEQLRQLSVCEDLCTLCFDGRASMRLLPCGHKGFCSSCVVQLEVCPMCRASIQEYAPDNTWHSKVGCTNLRYIFVIIFLL